MALEDKPWFGRFLEFDFSAQYNYSFFKKVDHALKQLKNTSNDHVLASGLQLCAPETWHWEAELEFANTPRSSWGYRSFALQIRKLWLDDVSYDPVSVSTGFVFRDVSTRMLHDISTPYHARENFEFHTAIGKEWSRGCYWYFRTFALVAIGQASRGLPWFRADLTFWGNYKKCHQWRLYGKSYFGLGRKKIVNISDFNGWANFRHKSIDLGMRYRYLMGIYGSLSFDYIHRIYARSFPEHVNFFIFTYKLPFCLF